MKKTIIYLIALLILTNSCGKVETETTKKFNWKNATIYFLLTDRFNNGDSTNDVNFSRDKSTGVLRGFQGGDLKGVIQKIESGYFDRLGVSAIWMTPLVEQVHGRVDEGQGGSYGFHGYWTKDWTALDPNFGTNEDLEKLVKVAHKRGIRIILDAVLNHTGPVTSQDPAWPSDWVRISPACNYQSYESTITCTLVKNLPDIRTESNQEVSLPPSLVEKWKAEGRYEKELKELDDFFATTGYPRYPSYYVIKWLSDYVKKYGIDGYRVDTAKHVEASVWAQFKQACQRAFDDWKKSHPNEVMDDNEFYTIGEVYGYGIQDKLNYHYPDSTVNFYENGFNCLINFSFINNAEQDYEELFSSYSTILSNNLGGNSVLNYLSSHDDGHPFDAQRLRGYEGANKLLLAPGMAQIYYGDESNRSLQIDGTKGDATLRSNMNWNQIENDSTTQSILSHWQKLAQFRLKHPAIGAGVHQMISKSPYTFSRTLMESGKVIDKVIISMNITDNTCTIPVGSLANEGDKLYDFYSKQTLTVHSGVVDIKTKESLVLLEKIN